MVRPPNRSHRKLRCGYGSGVPSFPELVRDSMRGLASVPRVASSPGSSGARPPRIRNHEWIPDHGRPVEPSRRAPWRGRHCVPALVVAERAIRSNDRRAAPTRASGALGVTSTCPRRKRAASPRVVSLEHAVARYRRSTRDSRGGEGRSSVEARDVPEEIREELTFSEEFARERVGHVLGGRDHRVLVGREEQLGRGVFGRWHARSSASRGAG